MTMPIGKCGFCVLATAFAAGTGGFVNAPLGALLRANTVAANLELQQEAAISVRLRDTGYAARLPASGPAAPPPQVFAAAVGQSGSLFVLDSRAMSVFEFDARGVFRRVLAGPGRGPAQFYYPSAIAADASGDIYVLDLGNERVVGFLHSGAGLDTTTISVPGASSGLCAMQATVLTFGRDADSLLRVVRLDGRPHSGIGAQYSSETLIANALANGYLLCVPERQLVVVLPRLLSELRAYDLSSGRLVWSANLPGYLPSEVALYGRGVRIAASVAGADDARGIHLLPEGVLAVQLLRYQPQTPGHAPSPAQLRTQYFQLRDGQFLGQQQDLPRLLAVSLSRMFAVDPRDSLTIRAYDYSLGGRLR